MAIWSLKLYGGLSAAYLVGYHQEKVRSTEAFIKIAKDTSNIHGVKKKPYMD
jgi:hypothetical protein